MIKPKRFISISTESLNGKLVLINTSIPDKYLLDENGIDAERAIEFLFSLVWERSPKETTVFVTYDFRRDNEFIFSTLPASLRDKVFESDQIAKRKDELENENENFDAILFGSDRDSQEYEQADFFKHVNRFMLRDLSEVTVNGYQIKLCNGKFLSIRRGSRIITFYDISSFFTSKTLADSFQEWSNRNVVVLDSAYLDNRFPSGDLDGLAFCSVMRCGCIAKLAKNLNSALVEVDINLTRFTGSGAIASKILSKGKAKTEFHNYRYRRQLSPELHKAVWQSYYSGRTEQFKKGTVKDVFIYDINSAYAYASSRLPRMLRKPRYARAWKPVPFSIWFVTYDFTRANNRDPFYFGLFPNREFSNFVKYKLKGSGYFWQPEVSFALHHFPECIEIKQGFILDYEQAEFTTEIERVYALRQKLAAEQNPLEKVIKKGLASLYGKFKQSNGKGHYYNLFYSGFITSLTRSQLLNATLGNEKDTVAFSTDAVHSTNPNLPVPVNDELGSFKKEHYDYITYLDNGVYRAYQNGQVVKEKTRGFKSFNFDQALAEIKDDKSYTALIEFFVGHNFYSKNLFKQAEYLNQLEILKRFEMMPDARNATRIFDMADFDPTAGFTDSRILTSHSGLESGLYKRTLSQTADIQVNLNQ
jgi:hypothetical protein